MTDEREAELAGRLQTVQGLVGAAAERSGRAAADVTLIVITKTWPADDIERLARLGVRDVGENRHQDAEPKAIALSSTLSGLGVRWHFVGQVQSNKAPRIAAYADVVHSVDSAKVAARLDQGATRFERVVDCFVQVSLDEVIDAGARGGIDPADLESVATAVLEADALRLVGVMGVPPLDSDPRPAFQRLKALSERLRAIAPAASAISGGMTGDFEIAIEEGATHVRVGTAILGQRPQLR